jgi:hypothetical protein
MRSRRLLESIQVDVRRLRKEIAEQGRGDPEGATRPEMIRSPARYEAELADLAAQLEATRQSESYRLGHAIVRTFTSPVQTLRRLGSRRGASRRGSAPRRAQSRRGSSERTGDAGAFPIPGGDRTAGPLFERASTTMFVAWGLSADELRSLADDVSRLQLMLRDFKPLFVTDSQTWSGFQEHGYWFEYIPSAEEWRHHHDPDEWPEYIAGRMDSIIATYAPDRIVVYDHDGTANQALRSGVLNSIVGGRSAPVERAKLPR